MTARKLRFSRVFGVVSSVQDYELDGVLVRLVIRWTAPAGWAMWTYDPGGVLLAGPIPLVVGGDLFDGAHHIDGIPPGELRVYAPNGLDPAKDTADVAAWLIYREASA